jgi:hypothetical protein
MAKLQVKKQHLFRGMKPEGLLMKTSEKSQSFLLIVDIVLSKNFPASAPKANDGE